MSADDELRSALRNEADRYDPADDGWAGISTGVRVARRRRRTQGGVLGGLAVSGLAIAIGLTAGGGGTDVDAGRGLVPAATTQGETGAAAPTSAVPTTETPTTLPATTPPATTPTTTAPQPAGPFPGIWPFASQTAVDDSDDGDTRFGDPRTTAAAFAREYVGMLDPAVGEAVGSDGGTVGVEVRPRGEDGDPVPDGGPSTVVTLRSYETAGGATVWTVVSAASHNLVVVEPAPGDVVGDVVRVRGRGTGYEGSVVAEVRQDGMELGSNLGEAVGITGSMGDLGPLSLDVSIDTPTEPGGALLVTTDTGLDGVGVPEFTVVRLTLGGAAPRPAPGPAPSTGPTDCRVAPPEGKPTAEQMDVTVFFVCNAAVAAGDPLDGAFVPVVRRTTRDVAVLGATLQIFLAGTSVEEDDERGVSAFTSHAETQVQVALEDGTAIVDFDESLTRAATGASTSAGSELFRGALNRTVLQFPTVERIEYRLGGSCGAFWQWQQVGDCRLVTRNDL